MFICSWEAKEIKCDTAGFNRPLSWEAKGIKSGTGEATLRRRDSNPESSAPEADARGEDRRHAHEAGEAPDVLAAPARDVPSAKDPE